MKTVRYGSALIMTVVLTVLLAIVAVMFVATARMDVASTSNIANNKMLDLAAESIMDIINLQLVSDVPGVAGQEYYDYPGPLDPWLASAQPYLVDDSNTIDPNDDVYKWHQISDITGHIARSYPNKNSFAVRYVNVKPSSSTVIREYPKIKLNADDELDAGTDTDGLSDSEYRGQLADADGDGIADSKWFELENIYTSQGKKIYAAVRIIDNGSMINVNTAHTFDPLNNEPNINGASQMQINLASVLKGWDDINDVYRTRCNETANTPWSNYEQDVIWQYGIPINTYTPFDISDELELRYRYCIDSKFAANIEFGGYPGPFPPYTPRRMFDTLHPPGEPDKGHLYDTSTNPKSSSDWRLVDWQGRITDPCHLEDDGTNKSDRRHILTAYNFDSITNPAGGRMMNINDPNINDINNVLVFAGLPAAEASQIAANIKDFRDTDSVVTKFGTSYGFERPCIYISEIAFHDDGSNASYAIELYNPYNHLLDPNSDEFTLVSTAGWTETIEWGGTNSFYIITDGPEFAAVSDEVATVSVAFNEGDTIYLMRTAGLTNIVVDAVAVPFNGWMAANGNPYSIERDINYGRCIRRLWDTTPDPAGPTLDAMNIHNGGGGYIQACPKNAPFTNIGELGNVFRVNMASINSLSTQAGVFVDLANPVYQQIFNYLTVIDPAAHGSPQSEWRIKGRININTASPYVIEQLPWVSRRNDPAGYFDDALAQAIVAYRDKLTVPGDPNYSTRLGVEGFENIGQLCNVTDPGGGNDYRIDYYSLDAGDQAGFPDITPGDNVADDFEERDLIFARISNLVTVRSDVFTAYILVRICTNIDKSGPKGLVEGPQKRYMAILDRSEVRNNTDKVKVVSFHPVPEAK
ncbi:MAG: hypothetical protein JW806_06080 [Sedimentisphaerales bacterium]|nr:hypothetical protein [Sedimentisphaerales bacterium]